MYAWSPEQKDTASARMKRVWSVRRVVARARKLEAQVTIERLDLGEPSAPAIGSTYEHLTRRCASDALDERLYLIEKRREARR